MAIDNGKKRIENIRVAMHKEIDRLIDEFVLKEPTRGFTISFDCGIDRVLSMNMELQKFVKGVDSDWLFMANDNLETAVETEETDSEGE